MKRLLWIGDAACPTGFARCTHKTLEHLFQSWDVTVLGMNYKGDPHGHPYPIYPAKMSAFDPFGLKRVEEMVVRGTDIVVVQNDPWNVPAYLEKLKDVPVVASMPVDGKNCRGTALNGLTHAIFWTRFGLNEARQGGYLGNASIIPLGVDLRVYKPIEKIEARRLAGLPNRLLNKFIVGNVNRNHARKRLDLTIQAFAKLVIQHKVDAYLVLLVPPSGDAGFDCRQLAQYYGIGGRVITSEPNTWQDVGEEALNIMYNCFDVQLNTAQGEGWGLCTMEGMAAGVPQVVTNWAALPEWTDGAAITVTCATIAATPNNINVIGGVIDVDACADALHLVHRDASYRQKLRESGLELVSQEKYRWENIGAQFDKVLNYVLEEKQNVLHAPRRASDGGEDTEYGEPVSEEGRSGA